MKIALLILTLINVFDLWVLPILGSKTRSGANLDQENTWLPFSGLYKLLIVFELFLVSPKMGGLNSNDFGIIVLLTLPFLFDWMALWGFFIGKGTYTIRDPWTSTLDDILKLKEHRFRPVYSMNHLFFTHGVMDNLARYATDVVLVGALIKTLHFL